VSIMSSYFGKLEELSRDWVSRCAQDSLVVEIAEMIAERVNYLKNY